MSKRFTVVALLAAFALDAQAGGLWIYEFAIPAQGRASAGVQAGVDDASAALLNPASMTRLEGHQMLAGLQAISSETEFTVIEATPINGFVGGGDQGDTTPAAGLYYSARLSERWSAGFSFAGWSGAVLDPDDDWAGRFQTNEVELLAIAAMPSVAYKVNDWLSLGVAVPMLYTDLTLRLAVPNINDPVEGNEGAAKVDGNDFVPAVNLSTLFTLSDRTRIGITYNSKFDAEYDGDLAFTAGEAPINFVVAVDTELTFAEFLRIGAMHAFSEKFRAYYTFGWENWSEMSNIIVSGETNGAVLSRNWHDTYHNAVGFELDATPRFTVMGGFAYDTSPTNAANRTADMPIDEQFRYTGGFRFRRNNGQHISASVVYADYGDAPIDASGFSGRYKDNRIVFFALTMDFSFNRGFRESGLGR